MEKVMALLDRVEEGAEIADIHIGTSAQQGDPSIEYSGVAHSVGLVGTEGRINLGLEVRFLDRDVVRKIVSRIVGRANDVDAGFGQNATNGKFGRVEFGIGGLPD